MIKELPTAAPPSPSEIKATGSTRQPSVSITVVSFNTRDHLAASLKTLVAQDYPGEVEIVVVDNASEDGSAAMIEEHFPEVALIENLDNRGFAAANNQALAACRGDIICLVNPDALLRPDALSQAIDHLLQNPETGICGGLLVDENGERHPSARRFPTSLGKFLMLSGISARFPKSRILAGQDYDWFDHLSPIQVDWVPGAFTCIRRSLIEDLGFFDERYFLYYEETDLCLRAKRHGWHIDLVPAAVIEHEGGASSKTVKSERFDGAGAQLLKFRTRAECLYHRKNFGLVAVLANLGIEWLWHAARRVVNLRPGASNADKRAYSREIQSAILTALRDTSLGSVSPQRPW